MRCSFPHARCVSLKPCLLPCLHPILPSTLPAGSELGGGGGGHRPGSKAAEGARFLALLRRAAERQGGKDTFGTGELFTLASDANLKVRLVRAAGPGHHTCMASDTNLKVGVTHTQG